MTMIWEAMLAEPRWIAIIGLVLDAVGAVLVAWTAWARVKMTATWEEFSDEAVTPLKHRRRMVVWGGTLLVVGFGLQAIAALMQMGHKPPGLWTI